MAKNKLKTWPHMRVRATRFGGKEAAEEREAAVLRKVFPSKGDLTFDPVDGEGDPALWEDAPDPKRKVGSLGELLQTAINKGKVQLGPHVHLPTIRKEDMARLHGLVREIAAAMVREIPWDRWHEEVNTLDGVNIKTNEAAFFAWESELDGWNLSDEAWEFMETRNVFAYDHELSSRKLSISSLRRAVYESLRTMEVKKAPVVRFDIEARLLAALENA